MNAKTLITQKSINTSFDADGVVIIKRKKIMKIENKGTLLGKGKSGGYGYETKKIGLIILAVGASVFFRPVLIRILKILCEI